MDTANHIFKPTLLTRLGGLLTAWFGVSLGQELIASDPIAVVAASVPALALLYLGWRIATTSLSFRDREIVVRNVLRTQRIPIEHARVLATTDDARTSSRWGVMSRHAPTMVDDNTVRNARLLRLVDAREPDREISVAASVGRRPSTFDVAVEDLRLLIQAAT